MDIESNQLFALNPGSVEELARSNPARSLKFIIRRATLWKLVKCVGMTCPKASDTFRLSVNHRQISIEYAGVVAGIHSTVIAEGEIQLPAAKFVKLLNTYKRTRFLTLESCPNGLKIENCWMKAEI